MLDWTASWRFELKHVSDSPVHYLHPHQHQDCSHQPLGSEYVSVMEFCSLNSTSINLILSKNKREKLKAQAWSQRVVWGFRFLKLSGFMLTFWKLNVFHSMCNESLHAQTIITNMRPLAQPQKHGWAYLPPPPPPPPPPAWVLPPPPNYHCQVTPTLVQPNLPWWCTQLGSQNVSSKHARSDPEAFWLQPVCH